MPAIDSRIVPILFLGAMVFIGIIVIFVGLPLLERFTLLFEAFSLAAEGIGEYFGNPRLVWLGCLVFILLCCGCFFILIVAGGATLTCGTANPSQFCRIIGR